MAESKTPPNDKSKKSRSFGSFASAFSTTALRPRGRSGRSWWSGGGGSTSFSLVVARLVSVSNMSLRSSSSSWPLLGFFFDLLAVDDAE